MRAGNLHFAVAGTYGGGCSASARSFASGQSGVARLPGGAAWSPRWPATVRRWWSQSNVVRYGWKRRQKCARRVNAPADELRLDRSHEPWPFPRTVGHARRAETRSQRPTRDQIGYPIGSAYPAGAIGVRFTAGAERFASHESRLIAPEPFAMMKSIDPIMERFFMNWVI